MKIARNSLPLAPAASWGTSKRATAIVGLLCISIGGMLLAIFGSNVIPTRAAVHLGLIAGLICGIGWVWAGSHARSAGAYTGHKNLSKPWLLYPMLFLIGLFCGYGSFAWTVPWLINIAAGSSSKQTFVVEGFAWGGRKACSTPDIGQSLFELGPRALCVAKDAGARFVPGSKLRVVGKATFLGQNADEIYLSSGAQ